MLPAAARMRERREFTRAIRAGRRSGRATLDVHFAPGTTRVSGSSRPPPARVGFVVAKTVGPAVVRNRVRRRLRHLVRDRLDRLPPGAALVVRALPAAAGANHGSLSADLDAALTRAGVPA